MASVTVAFDTITKLAQVSVDGTAVADLSECHFYGDGSGRFMMEMYSRVEDKAAGMYKSTRVCAAEDGSLVQSETDKDGKALNPVKVSAAEDQVLAEVAKRYGVKK